MAAARSRPCSSPVTISRQSTQSAIIAAAGDVNGDGGDDLVVLTPENGAVYIYLAGGARELPLASFFQVNATAVGGSLAALFGTAPKSP